MLDAIEDYNGPVMADRVLAYVRKAFNWWMVQDEDFKSPIVRGMARTKPGERSRKRTLTDDELRDVWAALEHIDGPPCYSAYVKTLLLTMTRRNEVSDMVADDGDLCVIPAARYKNKQVRSRRATCPSRSFSATNRLLRVDLHGRRYSSLNGSNGCPWRCNRPDARIRCAGNWK